MIILSSAKIQRRTHIKANSHSQTKLSWQTSYTVYIYENGVSSYSTGSWNQVDLNSPATSKKNGWYFTLSDKASVTHYWIAGDSSNYYYPYYLMNSSCAWTNPTASGKYVTFYIKTSKTATVSIIWKFEYHSLWSEINEDELASICTTLNNNASAKKTLISGYVTTATTEATTYITNTASATSVNSGTAAITTQIAALNTENTTLTTDIATQTAIVTTNTAAIATKNLEIAALQDEQTKLINSINQSSSLITTLTDSNTSLTAQKTAGTTDSATYLTQMTTASDNVKSTDGQLKVEAANASTYVDTAETALLTNNSLDDYTTNLASILP